MNWFERFWKRHVCSFVPDELAKAEFGSEKQELQKRNDIKCGDCKYYDKGFCRKIGVSIDKLMKDKVYYCEHKKNMRS